MAFIGIFALAWFLVVMFFIALFVFIFVFIPCLIIFIINLVKGIKNKWPKGNTIGVIITGIVLSVIIAFTLAVVIMIAVANANQTSATTSDSSVAISLQYLLSQINY